MSTTSFLGDQEEQNAYHMVKRRREHASLVTSSGLYELQRYLNQPLLEIKKEGSFDLLGWWKTNQSKYPILSIRACEILSVHEWKQLFLLVVKLYLTRDVVLVPRLSCATPIEESLQRQRFISNSVQI